MQPTQTILGSSAMRHTPSRVLRPTPCQNPKEQPSVRPPRSSPADASISKSTGFQRSSTVSQAYSQQHDSNPESSLLFRQEKGSPRPVSAYGVRNDRNSSSHNGDQLSVDRSSPQQHNHDASPSPGPMSRMSRSSPFGQVYVKQRTKARRVKSEPPPPGSFFVNGFNINGNGSASPPAHWHVSGTDSTPPQPRSPSITPPSSYAAEPFRNDSVSSQFPTQATGSSDAGERSDPNAASSGPAQEKGWDYKYPHLPCSSPCSPDDIPMRQLEALFQNTLRCPRLPCRVHDFMQRESSRRQLAADVAFREAIAAKSGGSSSHSGNSNSTSGGSNSDLYDFDEQETAPNSSSSGPSPAGAALICAPPIALPIAQITLCIEALARQYGRELVLFWVCRTPRILLCNAATTPAHIEAIRLMLDLQGADMAMLLRKNPYLLVTDIRCLRFRFEALHRSTTLDHDQILFMVKKCPLVFNFEGETLARLVANLRDLCSTRELWHQDFEQITPSLLAFFIRDHGDLLSRLEFLVVTGESPTKHLKEIFKISNNLFLRIHHGYRLWARMRSMRALARGRGEPDIEEVEVKPAKKVHFHAYR